MSDDWHNLIKLSELEAGDVTAVRFGQSVLAVFDGNNGISVSDARCTHAGANLCDGYFDGRYIECPLHQGLFDCVTGAAKAAPVVKPLKVYESRVHNAMVQIRLSDVSK